MSISTYEKICSRNRPGNMAIFIIDMGDITSVVITSGEVSEINLPGGSSFKKIDADLNTISRQELIIVKGAAKSYQHIVAFSASNLRLETNDLSNQLKVASRCGIVAIVVDANSQSWLVGWNYIEHYLRGLFLREEDQNSSESIVNYSLQTVAEYEDIPLNEALNNFVLDVVKSGGTELGNLESITVDSTIITVDSTTITVDRI